MHGASWTADRVKKCLIEGLVCHIAPVGLVEDAAVDASNVADAVRQALVGRHDRNAMHLIMQCRALADDEKFGRPLSGRQGYDFNIEKWCEARGIWPKTHYRRANRGAKLVADWLNDRASTTEISHLHVSHALSNSVGGQLPGGPIRLR